MKGARLQIQYRLIDSKETFRADPSTDSRGKVSADCSGHSRPEDFRALERARLVERPHGVCRLRPGPRPCQRPKRRPASDGLEVGKKCQMLSF